MMPLMTVWMGYVLPAALCVYWICNAAFSCLQELFLNKHFNKLLDREETDKERQKREARYAKMQAARENYNSQLAGAKGEKKPQPQPKKKKSAEHGASKMCIRDRRTPASRYSRRCTAWRSRRCCLPSRRRDR